MTKTDKRDSIVLLVTSLMSIGIIGLVLVFLSVDSYIQWRMRPPVYPNSTLISQDSAQGSGGGMRRYDYQSLDSAETIVEFYTRQGWADFQEDSRSVYYISCCYKS